MPNHTIDHCPSTCAIGTMPIMAIRRLIVRWWLTWPFGPDDTAEDRIYAFRSFFKGVTSTLLLTGHQQIAWAISDMEDDIERECHSRSYYGDANVLEILELWKRQAAGDTDPSIRRRLDEISQEHSIDKESVKQHRIRLDYLRKGLQPINDQPA